MIDFEVSEIPGGQRLVAVADHEPASWSDVSSALVNDADFRRRLIGHLAGAPFDAFFWECTPVSATSIHRGFEMVLIDAPALGRLSADDSPFADKLDDAEDELVCVFPNLGRNAVLVVPTPIGHDEAYAHLATFVRGGPAEQVDALLQATASTLRRHLDREQAPVWLSTSGLGVAWVHVRLDSRPKYYTHRPFRESP